MKTLTFVFAFLIVLNANAQWTADTNVNTLVDVSPSGYMQAIGTSTGMTYVVFWKSVPAPTYYELRVQLLDANGFQQFGPDGILVSETISMSSWTAIMSINIDANDNLYIGCTGTNSGAGYAFKIDLNGNKLWGPNGVTFTDGWQVIILPLSSGDAIVAWNATGPALMQRYDASGTAQWATPQQVNSGGSSTCPGDMFELASGDYIMVFHVTSVGISSTLYAQRYNHTGAPQWAAPVQITNTGTVFNTTYSGTQDGDIVYYGYSGSVGLRFDSYLQRIDPDGTLPWGINGMDFDINQTDYEMYTKIAFFPGSQYVWSICTYSNPSQSNWGEYVQKFDKATGARQFTNYAKVVYPISNNMEVHASNLHLTNDQPLFLLKRGYDNGVTPTTLRAVKLDANGSFAWPEHSKPMATFSAHKERTNMTRPVNGQAVAVFIEDKGAGSLIYAQNINEDIVANFTAVQTNICTGDAVNFIDNSSGAVLNWDWSFTGGTPATSTLQDPTITYNTAGTYDVRLIVADGVSTDTLTIQDYIHVYDYPVADAGADVTICPGTPTTITATGGTSYLWNTNPQQTTASIVVSPMLQTTYVVTVSNNICTDTDEVTVYMAEVVHLGNDTTISQGDTIILDAGPNFLTYLWSDGSNGQYLKVGAAGTYWVQVSYPGGCMSSDTIVVSIGYSIQGTISYKNAANTAINNTMLYLEKNGTFSDSLITDANGYYIFNNTINGDYHTIPYCTKNWGGTNSTDALAIMKHFVGLIYLTGLNEEAGDVNASGYINAADALMAQQRYLGMITSFPAGDWLFEDNLLPLLGVSIVNNFYSLCYGDVNGSYTPPSTKLIPTVSLSYNNTVEAINNESFVLPLITDQQLNIAAITLELTYPKDILSIEDVNLGKNSNDKVLFNAENGSLRISWFSLEEIDFNAGDVLLNLTLKYNNSNTSPYDCSLALGQECELADSEVNILNDVKLSIPYITVNTDVSENSLGYNYPNPFSNITTIDYYIDTPGFVSLRITDMLGKEIALLVNEFQSEGRYKIDFDGSGLESGIYLYNIEITGDNNNFRSSRIMNIQ